MSSEKYVYVKIKPYYKCTFYENKEIPKEKYCLYNVITRAFRINMEQYEVSIPKKYRTKRVVNHTTYKRARYELWSRNNFEWIKTEAEYKMELVGKSGRN